MVNRSVSPPTREGGERERHFSSYEEEEEEEEPFFYSLGDKNKRLAGGAWRRELLVVSNFFFVRLSLWNFYVRRQLCYQEGRRTILGPEGERMKLLRRVSVSQSRRDTHTHTHRFFGNSNYGDVLPPSTRTLLEKKKGNHQHLNIMCGGNGRFLGKEDNTGSVPQFFFSSPLQPSL